MKTKNEKLAIILGTYNRLPMLKKCLNSFLGKIKTDYTVTVIDAGSTDGTLEYLHRFKKKIYIVMDGEKIGQTKSLNKVLALMKSKYFCWISDDNVLQPEIFDKAVRILDTHDDIGMVGLKVKDVTGPYTGHAYIGGISPAGILNVNQGMLRLNLMKQVGYFDEKFPDYGMDTDLTTRILLSGYKVVYTKDVAILHYRDYQKYPGAFVLSDRKKRTENSHNLYVRKYRALCRKYSWGKLLFFRALVFLRLTVFFNAVSFFRVLRLFLSAIILFPLFVILGRTRYAWIIGKIKYIEFPTHLNTIPNPRDWNNILRGQYISLFDLWKNRRNEFYLVQKMPGKEPGRILTDNLV